jgi:glyoxylase-like metal-dependent hydrolase (beta-lactamase superfamily II)
MTVIAPGIRFLDLRHQGAPQVVATAVLEGTDKVALIDPGPTSTLTTLTEQLALGGLTLNDVEAVLLTHIHLDHAGACGTIVRQHPGITVYVHERGAKHLIDPEKLLNSATRLYGSAMDRLWGAFEPVPAANIRALAGGETVSAGGHTLQTAYTPGHASHHLAYFDAPSRIAFVGDVAGVSLPPAHVIVPPTPPPDIDIEAWVASIDRVMTWHPAALFLTHFGPVDHPVPHMKLMVERLHFLANLAKDILARPGTDAEKSAMFVAELHRDFRRVLPEADAARYELAVAADHCWMGLARYWKKRGAAASAAKGA